MQLSAISLALTRAGMVSAFSPLNLFTSGAQGAWYDPADFSTLYEDASGTIPITSPLEKPVGLMLDKSKGITAYSNYFGVSGNYLTLPSVSISANQDFTIECWVNFSVYTTNCNLLTIGAGWNSANSLCIAPFSNNGLVASVDTQFNTGMGPNIIANNWYHVAVSRQGSSARCFVNGNLQTTLTTTAAISGAFGIGAPGAAPFTSSSLNANVSNVRLVIGTALYTTNFTPSKTPLTAVTGTSILTCQSSAIVDTSPNHYTITTTGTVAIAYNSPFLNNAFQSTTTSRPTLSARYNLLINTVAMSGGSWMSSNVTSTANQITAPDGTLTGELVTAGAGSTYHFRANGYVTTPTVNNAFSVSLAKGTQRYLAVICGDSSGNRFGCTVDTTTWSIVSSGVGGTGSLTSATIKQNSLDANWYDVTIVGSTAYTSTAIYVCARDSATWNGETLAAAAGGGTWYNWGFDLRVANDGVNLPSYQRVDTATSYDYAGFPPYLKFDGTDDGMATGNIDFTATDKMSVFAGVRKLDNPGYGVIAELSASFDANGGVFTLGSGSGLVAGSKGSLSKTVTGTASAPITAAATLLGDIAAPSISIRVNGSATTSTATQGTVRNYGAYPLYIGRRGDSTFPFLGRLYSLVVVGKLASAAEIASTEAWLNNKTKAY